MLHFLSQVTSGTASLFQHGPVGKNVVSIPVVKSVGNSIKIETKLKESRSDEQFVGFRANYTILTGECYTLTFFILFF